MDINRLALTERNRDSLAPLLSEHMVIQCPGMGNAHIEGRQNALDAYDQYAGYAKVHEVITSEPLVQLYDGNLCAVVGYHYEFRTETVAEHKPETFIGKDMYFLVREDGRWVAAAQHYSIESTN